MTNRKHPDDSELAQFALASLINAVALLSDADLLLASSRWPRAYSLSVLAAEESAKFQTYSAAIGWDGEFRAKLLREARDHRAKLAFWEGQRVDMQDWGPIESEEAFDAWEQAFGARKQVAAAMHGKKLDGFYVGIDGSGTLQQPDTAISEQDARDVFELASSVVMPLASLFLGEDPGATLDAAAERLTANGQLLGPILKEMAEAKTRAEKEAASEPLRALMQRLTGGDIPATPSWSGDQKRAEQSDRAPADTSP